MGQTKGGTSSTPGTRLKSQTTQTLLKSHQEQKLLKNEQEKKLLKSRTESRSLLRDQAAHKEHSAQAQAEHQENQVVNKATTARQESVGLKSQAAAKIDKAKIAAGPAAKR